MGVELRGEFLGFSRVRFWIEDGFFVSSGELVVFCELLKVVVSSFEGVIWVCSLGGFLSRFSLCFLRFYVVIGKG